MFTNGKCSYHVSWVLQTWDQTRISPSKMLQKTGDSKKTNLVGGFNPSEKYESQLGWLFPIYGKITRCSPRTQMLTRMLMVQMSKHMDMQSPRTLSCNSLIEQSCTYFPCYQCAVWSVECSVRSVECGVWSGKCGVRSVEFVICRMWGVECRVYSVECGV